MIKIGHKNANTLKVISFYRKAIFFWKKQQLEIENSGFVKTCDDHVHSEGHGWPSQEEF